VVHATLHVAEFSLRLLFGYSDLKIISCRRWVDPLAVVFV
jgi:hypothetical protein